MKVIDLLNRIANDEEAPEKIEYKGIEFSFDKNCRRYLHDDEGTLGEFVALDVCLNAEVEIIEEEKEIEKLDIDKNDIAWCEGNMKTDEDMVDIFLKTKDKINELIDAVNGIRKEK